VQHHFLPVGRELRSAPSGVVDLDQKVSVNAIQQHKFIWLDFVRGVSAIAVCASHLRVTMFTDYSKLESSGLLQKIFYALTGLGHQSVMVFFVLSGFFVGGSVLRAGQGFQPRNYAISRISRLWVVLVPALILTAVIDHLIGVLAPSVLTGAFGTVWSSGPTSAHEYSATLLNFFANLFFLQTIFTPVFGTNGPLWSLANEFWYYVLFPLCALALGMVSPNKHGMTLAARLVLSSLVVGLLFLLPTGITSGYLVWLLGVPVYFMVGRLSPFARRITLGVGLLAFTAALGYSKAIGLQAHWLISPDLLIGLAFCIVCIGLANMPPPANPRSLFVKASQGLSAFSYSLYLVHFPFVALIGSTVYGSQRLAPDAAGMVQMIGWMCVLMLVSAAFWWVFERRTEALRRAAARAAHIPSKLQSDPATSLGRL
jgi:peptidoglycan/LPS O-acetylase OafA/YrhL